MKVSELHRRTNVILLFAILVLNSVYSSDIGGPGTIYNSISFVLAIILLVVNRRYYAPLVLAFVTPLLFMGASLAVNASGLTLGSYRSSLATASGYLLLTLRPLPLNQKWLQKLMVAFVVVALGLSVFITTLNLTKSLVAVVANPNFNSNPNSAAIFFFICLVLSLVFTRGWLQLILAVGFFALSLTTGSRGVLVVGSALVAAYIFLGTAFGDGTGHESQLAKRRLLWIGGFASVPTLATVIVPGSIQFLMARLSVIGLSTASQVGEGRNLKWQHALEASQRTLGSLFFGYGPATAGNVINSGTHSSYVEAFTSVGWPFLLSSVAALAYLCYHHIKRSQRDCVLIIGAICLYGASETVLFDGLGTIWYLLIFVSLYYRTVDGPPRVSHGVYVDNHC